MIIKPESKNYSFFNLLSDNSLVQTWLAKTKKTGEHCIIKTISPGDEMNDNTKNSFLRKSYNAQKSVKSHNTITCNRKTVENDRIFVEYPYLDPKSWKKLTPRDFWNHFPDSLIQICQIVDYLHLLDLVHCDLKLDNFLINKSFDTPKIKLIDFDFLCPSGTSANAKIFGTPRHIAPEILENGKIIRQTDNYSVGIILSDNLEYLKHSDVNVFDISDPSVDKLKSFIKKLTDNKPIARPSILINSLSLHKLINKEKLEFCQKSLLVSVLISKYWTEKNKCLKNKNGLVEFLSQQNNIFGLHDEFVEDINYLLQKKQTAFLELFRYLINEANINLFEYWQFDISDKTLNNIYNKFGLLVRKNKNFKFHFQSGENLVHLLDLAQKINDGQKNIPPLKSYLVLNNAYEKYAQLKKSGINSTLSEILNALSRLAVYLGRSDEAISHLTKLLKFKPDEDKVRLDIIYRLAFLEITKQRHDQADNWIDKGLKIAERFKELDIYGDLLRLKAWIFGRRGDLVQSKKYLVIAEKVARAYDHKKLMGKIQHDIGMLNWQQGNYLKAEKFLLKSAEICEENSYKINLSVSYGNLALLNFEQSEYKKAIKYGELSLSAAGSESDNTVLSNIFITIVLSQSRLNNTKEVFRCLENIRTSNAFKNSTIAKQKYYFCYGTAMYNIGDLQAAAKAFKIGNQFVHPGKFIRSKAKNEYVQAKVALYQGKSSVCLKHINSARAIFEDLNDEASGSEVELIEKLNNEIYHGQDQGTDLIAVLKKLIRSRCYYYGAVCLLYLLLTREGNKISLALKIATPLLFLIRSGEVPLFKAVSRLVGSHGKILRKKRFDIAHLKDCYRILESAGDKFFAFLLCGKIADHYISNSQIKLASKFINHARQIANDLENNKFNDIVENKSKALSAMSAETFLVQKTILGISEILGDINDYDTAVNKLLNFVIKEVGAERGALLLASVDNPERLQIKSSVNCDMDSLKDIENISRSIPAHVSKRQKPLIIDDALNNKRTKQFKSIVAHNIRSVICLPVSIKNRYVGVLYLDHHTIPGLFDIGDILFVKSIANFISIVLSSLQDIKDADISSQQFKNQLENLGLKSKIVYSSQVMTELLDKLPDIAKSKASVLILGESGTGKELICDMIHKLSLRAQAPLVKLNSSAIASSLIESELFGVDKKVATGVEPREGKFSAADGGTLFFDEISDMPIEIQAKILRVVEEQTYEKVGSNLSVSTDIRFIYATNKDLHSLIKDGKFREDLYHRINTIEIIVPPLRHRPEDIPELIEHFLESFISEESDRPIFSEGAMYCLLSYKWPGNIRELRNLVERFCILYSGKKIKIDNLPKAIGESAGADSELLLKARIYELLEKYDSNQTRVAEILEIPLSTLRRKIKKFGL